MSQNCDCCTGIGAQAPAAEINPPGLTALSYRVGTHSSFLQTMLARLTGFSLDASPPAGGEATVRTPLTGLSTRDPADPSIALLDAWATVADVLSFYQERIANEGYLPTAQQRRSLLELARLIGYRLRPGVAASVRLAFTVAKGFEGILPAGTRAQSIPGAGQKPQFFETSAGLQASDAWNTLAPRLTRPQLITPAGSGNDGVPLVTGANVIDSVYLDGITTGIKPGDALFFIFGPNADPNASVPQQYMRLVADVDPQANQQRTLATLGLLTEGRGANTELKLYRDKARYLFTGTDLAQDVVRILEPVIANLDPNSGGASNLGPLLQSAMARLTLIRGIALQRGFSRVAAWLAMLLRAMQWMSLGQSASVLNFSSALAARASSDSASYGGPTLLQRLPAGPDTSPLAKLATITAALAQPPSPQPANALRLSRSVAESFAPQSDLAPRLLGALHPAAAKALYPAWSAIATPAGRVEVHAARVKASLFAANWAGPATVSGRATITTTFADPNISNAWTHALALSGSGISELPLDAAYEQIKPGSWVAVDRPLVPNSQTDTSSSGRRTTYHVVASLRVASLAAGPGSNSGSSSSGSGYAAKVTLLTLDPPWLSELSGDDYKLALISVPLLRETIVHAQSEPLALVEEPLDADVEGDAIDLAGVYEGLEPGRWIIVSGTRTDIANLSGVTASELAMVANVTQGEQAPFCLQFPAGAPPFETIHYTTDANAFGDRLVVGQLSAAAIGTPDANRGGTEFLSHIPLPDVLNQQFCDQVELASGSYANVYVPTALERRGDFSAFNGLLLNPDDNTPYPDGRIPDDRLFKGLYAWRVSSRPLHTVLNLASPLAYKYDRASITIYGNVADATHGQSTGEVLGNGDATQAFASFTLGQSPLTYVSAPTPSGTSSSLSVRVNELEWHELGELAGAGPAQRCFVTLEDDAQDTSITFGNGVHGARLPTGTANLKASYRYGIGKDGNVDAGQISQLATHPLGAQGVINPLPASGGADADRSDQARANAPTAVMALDRLVSVRDYADFSRTYAGIGKAVASRLSDGLRQVVHVTVAGAEDIPIAVGSDLYRNLLGSLRKYGDPHLPVVLDVRRVRLLVMAATIGLLPDYAWENVAPAVRAAVLAQFAFDARSLGQSAFLSEAIAAAQQVAGVAWVDVTTFDGVPEDIDAARLAGLGASLRRWPFVQSALASAVPKAATGAARPFRHLAQVALASAARQAAPDPARPFLPAELVFMTPDIPGTLLLTPANS